MCRDNKVVVVIVIILVLVVITVSLVMRNVSLVCVVTDRCSSIAKESKTRPTGRECEEDLSIELLHLSLRSVLT